jgi:hypothetical protein
VSVFVVLLLASAAAFAIGVTVERNQGHTEAGTGTTATTGSETGEHTEADEGQDSDETTTDEGTARGESAESLLGVNPESTVAVLGAVAASLLLAAAAWWRPTRPVLVVGGLFCLAAAALDVRELVHQLDENRNGVAALAGLVTVLHLTAALAAALTARGLPGRDRTAVPTPAHV